MDVGTSRPMPPVEVVPSEERGRSSLGWLESRHSFSFGNYYDPRRMGLGPLRVLNDDWVAPAQGFGAHAHRDMEIVSYVLEGALRHQDSAGNAGVIPAGEVQFMRAGSGVTHSEMNASSTEPVHFLQIWVRPRRMGLAPAYDQRRLDLSHAGAWSTVASGEDGGIRLDQDVSIRACRMDPGMEALHPLGAGRALFVFLVEGQAMVNGHALSQGDAAILRVDGLVAKATAPAQLLAFDVPVSAPGR